MTHKTDASREIATILEELKEEEMVPINMSTGEFTIECISRGLNEYRKDLVNYV
tara:strand:+ start:270 stop:431 length:162 start_codon:yes stop_codon:yes gene_type:complete